MNNVNLCDELESVIYYVHKQTEGEGLKNRVKTYLIFPMEGYQAEI